VRECVCMVDQIPS